MHGMDENGDDLKSTIDENSTVLEEFVFWLSRLHYPDVLNHFFLHLLPNDDYKKELTRAFVKNYTFTALSLFTARQQEAEPLANRIVHIRHWYENPEINNKKKHGISLNPEINPEKKTEKVKKTDFFFKKWTQKLRQPKDWNFIKQKKTREFCATIFRWFF